MKKWLFSISIFSLVACSSHKSADQPVKQGSDSTASPSDSLKTADSSSHQSAPQQQPLNGEIDPSMLPQRDTNVKVIREMPKPGGSGDKHVVDSLKQLKNKKKQGN